MTDIKEKLRDSEGVAGLRIDAADEIERLREDNAKLLIENRDLHIELALARTKAADKIARLRAEVSVLHEKADREIKARNEIERLNTQHEQEIKQLRAQAVRDEDIVRDLRDEIKRLRNLARKNWEEHRTP